MELEMNSIGPDYNGAKQFLGNYCPINVLERIFSYLLPKELCVCAQVNSYWNVVSSQNIFWKPLLLEGKKNWNQITNLKNGKIEQQSENGDASSNIVENGEKNYKHIYLSYKPEKEITGLATRTFQLFASVTRRYKLALFGSGLEKPGAKRIAQSILSPIPGSIFTSNGFHPGNNGVASGVCVRMSDRYNLIISFFYSNSRRIRENRLSGEHYSSILFDQKEEGGPFEVKPNIKQALQGMDGLVYVVSGESDNSWTAVDKNDLHLLQSVCDEKVPLLVANTVASADRQRIACADMIDVLDLKRLSRPWMISDVVESSLSGLEEGITWLVKHC